jgi:hypothetical protein
LLLSAALANAADNNNAVRARAVAPNVWFVQGDAAMGSSANRNGTAGATLTCH